MIVTEERNLLPKTLRRLNEETDDFDAWPVDVGRRHCQVRPDAGRHHHQDQEGQESKEAKADHDHQELTWSDNFCRAFIAHGSPAKRGPCAISIYGDSSIAMKRIQQRVQDPFMCACHPDTGARHMASETKETTNEKPDEFDAWPVDAGRRHRDVRAG